MPKGGWHLGDYNENCDSDTALLSNIVVNSNIKICNKGVSGPWLEILKHYFSIYTALKDVFIIESVEVFLACLLQIVHPFVVFFRTEIPICRVVTTPLSLPMWDACLSITSVTRLCLLFGQTYEPKYQLKQTNYPLSLIDSTSHIT